jgi:hypothetical protein
MSNEKQKDPSGIYEIKIQGHLDTRWAEWFYGLAITHEPSGATTLSGPLPDQIVLHSVLDRIRDMNLPLLSVNQIVSEEQARNDEGNGAKQHENLPRSESDPTRFMNGEE